MYRTTWMAGLALALTPALACAQGHTRWDVAPLAGLFAGHTAAEPAGGYQEEWFQAVQGGVTLGRYLTRHLKLGIEASGTTAGSRYLSRPVDLPGQPYPYWVSSDLSTSVRSFAGVVGWQFRDNEWVHPFIEAGVSVDVTRSRLYLPEYYLPRRDGAAITMPGDTLETSDSGVRGVVGGGAKVYFRERAFVRTDARLTFETTRQALAFRVGVGVDF